MSIDNEKARSIVNSSGFPLQYKVESLVGANPDLGWKVLTKEHSWLDERTKEEGFIDLVLEQAETNTILMVECKRVKDAAWIFMQEKKSPATRRHAKVWLSQYLGGIKGYLGWNDGVADPGTPESQFCVVAGQDPKSKPMLERVAADLIQATESFAEQDLRYHRQKANFGSSDFLRIFVPVIVTTAELKIFEFDVNNVSLADGEVSQSEARTVPFLRFRKQFSHREYKFNQAVGIDYRAIDREKENTVFVVNSNHVAQFLADIGVHEK